MEQGIRGSVAEITGNQMPSPDRESQTPKGIKTSVYVHEPTNINQVQRVGTSSFYKSIGTKLIKVIETDEQGNFKIELPEGSYSLFVKVNGQFYSNSFDANNNISLVTVAPKTISEVNILVSSNATF
ncbi:MAG TPA: hypothetical protein VM368_05780 [Flavisolibacter sp.]|nr:hypothetical protein [Flavisolibacter sp.]